MKTKLKLDLLGGLRLTLDGKPLALPSLKARLLLCYLAMSGRPHTREALAGLLWSELPEEAARANLRTMLPKLRQALGSYLTVGRDTVAFDRVSAYRLDVELFLKNLTGLGGDADIARLREAVKLYRGDFLADVHLEGAPLFEEWLLGQRERLKGLAVGAFHVLAAHHTERREWLAATDYLGRLLALEPWREDSHRQRMTMLALSGQRDAALAQFEACRRTLHEELGLKPSAETERLFERIRAGELAPQRPLHHNLPLAPTPFVARPELEEGLTLLANPACRLLTLTGLGGVGKTRLAVEMAVRAAADFKGDVWYVPLAGLNSAQGLAGAVAAGLGLSVSEATDLGAALLGYLRDRNLLLVLDNFEHLLAGATFAARILEAAPGVKLLITSRERLDLRGEWVVSVGGLDYPAADDIPDTLEDITERYSALTLFQQSALRADPKFRLTPERVRVVAQICELVGAVPLALELVAAWLRTLSPDEIRDEVARDLAFLVAPKDAPTRHSSIHAVLEPSWRLLTDEERAVLRRSTVFLNGFSQEAALEVAGATVPVLSALVDKALLHREADGRYRRHALVKRFADEKAVAQPEEAAGAQERHSAYYLGVLLRHEASLRGKDQREALSALEKEMDNLRRAWEWAADHGCGEALERVLPVLETVYALQGRFREARAVFELAAAKFPPDSLTHHRLRLRQARFEEVLGCFKEARELLWESLTLLEERGTREDVARTLERLGNTLLHQGAHVEVKELRLRCLDLYRELGHRVGVASTLNNLGSVAVQEGDFGEAKRLYEASLKLYRELGDYVMMALVLNNLGEVAFNEGRVREAEVLFQEALTLRREMGDSDKTAATLVRLGKVDLALGDVERAERSCREALRLALDIYAPLRIVQALLVMSALLEEGGRLAEALELADLVAHHPGSPAGHRAEADARLAALAAKLPAEEVAAIKAEGVAKDLLKVAEVVLRADRI